MTKRAVSRTCFCGFYFLAGIEWAVRLNRTQCVTSLYDGRNAISGIAKSACGP